MTVREKVNKEITFGLLIRRSQARTLSNIFIYNGLALIKKIHSLFVLLRTDSFE